MKSGPSVYRGSSPANEILRPWRGGAGFFGRVWHVIYRWGLLVPFVFLLLIARFAPIAYSGEFDTDEGVNLMKALLVSRGYALYSDIWSDQAPMATIILSQWIKWFGTSVVASRILVLLFSALLLWAFYQTIRLSVSELPALVGVALLLLSAWYVRLSLSVMIGLPALALAMLSIYLLLLAERRRGPWLTVASGLVLAASLQTKLFTGILVPVILVYQLFVRDSALRKRIERCAVWLAALLAALAVLTFIFRSFNLSQLVTPHLGAGTRTAFGQGNNLGFIGTAFLRHVVYLPLAIIGLVCAFKNRESLVLLPLGWLVMAVAFLIYETPVWYHHVPLLTIPLVWLAAFGIEAGFRALLRHRLARAANQERDDSTRRPTPPAGSHAHGGAARGFAMWAVVFLGAVVAILTIFDPETRRPWLREEIPGPVPDYSENVVDLLCPSGRSKEAWVFTDHPIYAFQAGLNVPPPIAVLTAKRLFSGTITEADLAGVLRTYRPEYVVLERYLPNYGQDFLAAVAGLYSLAREYEMGLQGNRGELLIPHVPGTEEGAAAARHLANARFGDWLSLAWNSAFAGQPGDVEAGNCLQVRDLQWTRPEAQSVPDLALSIRLADQTGEVWVQHDEQLGSDKNTLRDRAQLPYFVNLLVPEGTPPGAYQTQLVVYDPHSGQPLPVTATEVQSQPLGEAARSLKTTAGDDRLILGQVHITRPAQGSALRRPLADFGSVRLVEAMTPATEVSPGDAIPLSLLWQAGSDFHGESLVVVAQLLDKEGKVVASLEEEPIQGRYPTPAWQPRELVRDRHNLSVPQGTPPGRYDLIVGLYTLPDRIRLKTRAGLLGLAHRDYFPIRQVLVGSPPS